MCLCDSMGVDTCVVVWMFAYMSEGMCTCVHVCVCAGPPPPPPHTHTPMHISCVGGWRWGCRGVGGSVGIILCDVFVWFHGCGCVCLHTCLKVCACVCVCVCVWGEGA